jgi:hypothetical protein
MEAHVPVEPDVLAGEITPAPATQQMMPAATRMTGQSSRPDTARYPPSGAKAKARPKNR